MIHLVDEPYDKVAEKIDYMMGHEKGIREIFYDKRDRLYCSVIACLIKEGHNEVGFLNLVKENVDNILFLDEGIIERYRNRGYGAEAIRMLLLYNNFDEYIIGETKRNNIGSNKSAIRISNLVYQTNEKNYFLFQKEKTNKFLCSEEFYEMKKNIEKQKVLTKNIHVS